MQGVHAYVLSGMLAAGAVFGTVAVQEDAQIDRATTSSIHADTVFRLAARGSNERCRVVVSQAAKGERQPVWLGSHCAELAPELVTAASWTVDTGGMVTLADDTGEVLAHFAPGDGIAYESQEPGAPRFTLESDF